MHNTSDKFVENRKHIGSVVKKNRKKHNIRQIELAEDLGVNVSTVSRYESGEIDIPSSYLKEISNKCKFEPKEYFNKPNPYELLEDIVIKFNHASVKEKPVMEYPEDCSVDETTLEYLQDIDDILNLSAKIDSKYIIIKENLVLDIIRKDNRQKDRLKAYYDYFLEYYRNKDN